MPGEYCLRAPLGAAVLLVLALDCVTASEQAPPVPEADGLGYSDDQGRPLLVEELCRCHSAEDKKVNVRLSRATCRVYRLADVEGQAADAAAA